MPRPKSSTVKSTWKREDQPTNTLAIAASLVRSEGREWPCSEEDLNRLRDEILTTIEHFFATDVQTISVVLVTGEVK